MEVRDAAARARYWRRTLPLIVTAMALPLLLPRVSEGTAARRHVVAMSGFEFRPAVVRAAPGDTVIWRNDDAVLHTATGEGWSSGDVAAGASAKLVVGKRGQLEYICAYHPSMKGTIVVR